MSMFFKEIFRIRYVLILGVCILLIFYKLVSGDFNVTNKEFSLVVFGDNIKTTYNPFIKDGGVYVSLDTIEKVIDKDIYYDKVSSKVIITTYDDVVKLKVDDKKIYRNLETMEISNPVKVVDGQVFLPINELQNIYGIKVEYNNDEGVIVIDKSDDYLATMKYNKIKVYSDITTNSEVLKVLNKSDMVTAYVDNLQHVRWLKVKTVDNMVGYIVKSSCDISKTENKSDTDEQKTLALQDNIDGKINMFWQYGSNLQTLGDSKIEGVNVVSPTWYELSNSNGDISSEFNSEYFEKAKAAGYKIWPVITNGIDSANYSSEDTSTMLNSEYARENFIKNLLKIIKDNNLDGINIDFESMKVDDKDLYTQFVRELAPLLRKQGKILSVDMYFVDYIDRVRVGEATDYLVLMGYDQRGNWSSTSGSISEVPWVEKNIKSLIQNSNIDHSKIILGIPFYTRLWTETVGTEKLKTTVYSMQDCQNYITENNLTPTWDKSAGQNYVELTKGDVTYKLWIEDKDSIKERVEIVKNNDLAGISGWRKGLETTDIWPVINEDLQ